MLESCKRWGRHSLINEELIITFTYPCKHTKSCLSNIFRLQNFKIFYNDHNLTVEHRAYVKYPVENIISKR